MIRAFQGQLRGIRIFSPHVDPKWAIVETPHWGLYRWLCTGVDTALWGSLSEILGV